MAPKLAAVAAAAAAALLLQPVAAQTQCSGSTYAVGSVDFTQECYDAIASCASQFEANYSMVNCNDGKGNIYMQQQANLQGSAGSQNNDAVIAFQDIRDLCILSGYTSGTWGYSDNQWYWIAAEPACYTNSSTGIATHPPPYCIQNRDSSLTECYPEPDVTEGGTLKVLKTGTTKGGFTSSGRGWNSWGIQALQNGSEVIPSYAGMSEGTYTQKFIEAQCGELAKPQFQKAGFTTCSIDAAWSSNDPDEHGRIVYNSTRFNFPELGKWLHEKNLGFGVYVVPGAPCNAANKTILGTDITVGDIFDGSNDEIYCSFDYTKDGVQQWHDSIIELWTSWGIDFIKLDFVTPGSPQNGANLPCDSSESVTAYRKAIEKSGKKVRLDLSWKLCRNETWLPFWSGLAESMRTDQDIDNYGTNNFVDWQVGQRAIEMYRQYIGLQVERNVPITIHPDMDNLFVGNPQPLAGVNDSIRTTIANHWLGASANLVLGNDLTQMDALGYKLTTSDASIAAAAFFAKYPMQPRNPGSGSNQPKQLQAWIGGPEDSGREAYVLLVNYGPDQGYGGFSTTLYGSQAVTVSLSDLGIKGSWSFTDVWTGHSTRVTKSYTAHLTEGASQLLKLTRI